MSSSSENEYSDAEMSPNSPTFPNINNTNSTDNNITDGAKKSRTRRPNHNEIERMRRNSQRQRFEELRQLLPNLQGERATSVAIINGAISYIKDVQNRLAYMENILNAVNMTSPASLQSNISKMGGVDMFGNPYLTSGVSPPPPISSYDPFSPPSGKKIKKVSYIKVPTKPELFDTENILSYIQRSNAPIISNQSSPNMIPSPDNLFGSSSNLLLDEHLNERPKLRKSSFVPAIRRRNSSTSSSDAFSDGSTGTGMKRRESSLLLPTSDPKTYLFGKRDSMQTLFSGSLPMFFDDGDESLSSGGKCQKCGSGVDNLVMVDCGTCLGWFHIRCVGIDAQQIPIFWDCAECRKPSQIGSRSIPIKDLPAAPPIVSNGLEFRNKPIIAKAPSVAIAPITSPLNNVKEPSNKVISPVYSPSFPLTPTTTTNNTLSTTSRMLSPAPPTHNRTILPK